MAYKQINKCRICGNTDLQTVLDLGVQVLTGVFPKQPDQEITAGPLQLVKCTGSDDCCGLLQLAHSYDLDEMYGENYGYRSGLNQSMVRHLHQKIAKALSLVSISDKPLVLDIGSNDGTSLAAYPTDLTRVGMDPTAGKFRHYYPDGAQVIDDFFSASNFLAHFPRRKARVITSFSMFYDLEKPMEFVKEVAQILDPQGIWVFEQSYMPMMLETNSFDTACHEHLEYYAYKQIDYMLQRNGMKVVDVEFNEVNGGSFSITAALQDASYPRYAGHEDLLKKEADLDNLAPYIAFAQRTARAREDVVEFVKHCKSQGKKVAALGASTKGNVLLQYCGLTSGDIFAVAEINPDKYGTYTPGSLIPILAENAVIEEADYLIVLPWHFKSFFMEKYKHIAHKLVFPLPTLHIGQPSDS
jgi:NDP-4-keto-2,6-dideoxyhexose 3-C-methyltransferase